MAKGKKRGIGSGLRTVFWLAAGFIGYTLFEAYNIIRAADVEETLATPQNKGAKGFKTISTEESEHYTRSVVIDDGIERVTYTPRERKFDTPIFMQHGMWHGAWCWQQWQELFAEWGWESVSISLPGHAGSPMQKPFTEITLDYYLAFLRDEIDKLDTKPVLMGHSMGGALSQWYLRYVSDDLPAVVLVGSWVHDSAMKDGTPLFMKLDPLGILMSMWEKTATPYVRNPKQAAKKLISPHALYTPEELHARLAGESALVTLQHNPPFWQPPTDVKAPMLYVAGAEDAVVSTEGSRATAEYYGADFIIVPDSGHNIMMDAHYDLTASKIHDWLVEKGVK